MPFTMHQVEEETLKSQMMKKPGLSTSPASVQEILAIPRKHGLMPSLPNISTKQLKMLVS